MGERSEPRESARASGEAAPRSRVLARLASLAQIGELARRLIVGRKFTVFLLFYSVFEGIFQVRAPGGLYSEGRFLQYEFGRLTFGGA